jgi:hypothetical protein
MDASSLTRIAGVIARRRTTVGHCSTCHAPVFDDERHVRIRGVLVHRRCIPYGRRG